MDEVLGGLVDLVDSTDFAALTERGVARVVRHTIDTVGCGAGGFASEPARIARTVAVAATGHLAASVYGEPRPVLVDAAAFANATANRYLDLNDFGVSGHPSDMIPAVLAMAEAAGATGAEVVVAVHLAYEVATRLAEAVPPDGGWDQGVYCSPGIAAGLAAMLGLPRDRVAHAISLAIVPSVPLRTTRFGQLSQWKAAATGHAAMTACHAVRLAAAGMTGPPDPFEGTDGLLERVWPRFDLDLGPAEPSAIERASIKRHPACYWAQVPVDLVTELLDLVAVADIEAIDVATCHNAWRSIGGGRGDAAEKWRPATRETADHSMPYLMGATLADGRLTEAAFTPERLRDPELLAIVDRISVTERADLTRRSERDTCPTELTARLCDGSQLVVGADVPRGHHANPMTDEEVGAKFEDLASGALAPAQVRELGDRLWHLAAQPDLDGVAGLFRAFTRR